MSRDGGGGGGGREEREIVLTMCSPLRVLQIALSLSDNLWKLKSFKEIYNSLIEEFSSVEDCIYALQKAHMRSVPSLRSFPNVAFETVPTFTWLTMALSRLFKEGSSSASSSHASLLQAIDGVMSLALCPQVVSQAPQHFGSSETQATCDMVALLASLSARSFLCPLPEWG